MFLLELLVLGLKCWKTQTYFEKTWTLLTHIMVQGETLSTFLKQSRVQGLILSLCSKDRHQCRGGMELTFFNLERGMI